MSDPIVEPHDQTNRRNDMRLLTPLLVAGLVICGGFLFFAYRGDSGPSVAQAPAAQTTR